MCGCLFPVQTAGTWEEGARAEKLVSRGGSQMVVAPAQQGLFPSSVTWQEQARTLGVSVTQERSSQHLWPQLKVSLSHMGLHFYVCVPLISLLDNMYSFTHSLIFSTNIHCSQHYRTANSINLK